jgi:hypothetical protein
VPFFNTILAKKRFASRRDVEREREYLFVTREERRPERQMTLGRKCYLIILLKISITKSY